MHHQYYIEAVCQKWVILKFYVGIVVRFSVLVAFIRVSLPVQCFSQKTQALQKSVALNYVDFYVDIIFYSNL